jgi:CelD/BcsL family acetyltransferase involved in cellulose biosynthesis
MFAVVPAGPVCRPGGDGLVCPIVPNCLRIEVNHPVRGTADGLHSPQGQGPKLRAVEKIAMPNVTFELVQSPGRFDEIGNGWDELVQAAPRPCPFLLSAWCRPVLANQTRNRQVAIHLARRGETIVGALPFVVERGRYWRVARLLSGQWSYFADALLSPEEPMDTLNDLVEWTRMTGRFHFAKLWGVTSDSVLSRVLPPSDMRMTKFMVAPYLRMPDGWDAAYRAQTSSKSRNSHKRRYKQLEGVGRVEVSIAATAPSLAEALEAAFRINALRWTGAPDVSDFGRPRRAAFHRDVLQSMAKLKIPRILTLTLDGEPIAFMYYLLYQGGMYVLRLGFDPAYARYSPGLVANLKAFEAASAEGATTIEFLEGAERYKLELADGLRDLYMGVALATSATSRAAAGLAFSYGASRVAAKNVQWVRNAHLSVLASRRRREAIG